MAHSIGGIILAAGQGKRLHTDQPKVLADVMGRPSLAYVIRALKALEPERICVVVGHGAEQVQAAFKDDPSLTFVAQEERKGTAHAALCAEEALHGFDERPDGRIVVLYGDGPLVTPELLHELLAHHERTASAATMVSAEFAQPFGYGRVVRGAGGAVERIVEERDADAATRAIHEVNTGIGVFDARRFCQDLKQVGCDNAAREFYLTDVYQVVRRSGAKIDAYRAADGAAALGFNSLAELAVVREAMRQRIVQRHLHNGVDVVSPATVYIDDLVEIAAGARILPFCVFSGNVRIGASCEVGPFTHLRPGTVLKAHSEIGNFTEVKNSIVGEHTKAKHLTYLGDAILGADVNVGAGTITANYDGKKKYQTVVGDRAFIGSGTVFVAPSEMGKGAMTGAGAIVTRGTKIKDGEVVVGVPARVLRKKPEGQKD